MYMVQRRASFEEYLQFGKEGEHEVAELLIEKGVTIMPLYQFEETHAPFLVSQDQKLISPDLFCFGKDAFFVEVKTKRQWVVFRTCVETGLDKRLWDHYKNVKDATGKNIYLVFNHKVEEPTGFFFCELEEFTRVWDGTHGKELKYNSMVFYDISVLKKLERTP